MYEVSHLARKSASDLRRRFCKLFLLSCVAIGLSCASTFAITWDEPWHEEVLRATDTFALVQVEQSKEDQVTLKVLKNLAGETLPETVEVKGYSMLKLQSSPAPGRMHRHLHTKLKAGEVAYVFLTKGDTSGTWKLPSRKPIWTLALVNSLSNWGPRGMPRGSVPRPN